VTVPDANLLLYAYNADAPQHATARTWLEELFAGPEVIGLPWAILWAFARISTNFRAWDQPLPSEMVFRVLSQMLSHPRATLLHPGPRHLEILEQMVTKGQAIGSDLTDAVLAAIVIESGATLASNDADFSRFPGLKWFNPLKHK
jgi:toxin-antitoxin system PIN domain toxin